MVAQMASAEPGQKAELARALAGRGEQSAVPKLLELAQSGAKESRAASLRALTVLADHRHLAALVQLLLDAKTDAARTDFQETLTSVCERL